MDRHARGVDRGAGAEAPLRTVAPKARLEERPFGA